MNIRARNLLVEFLREPSLSARELVLADGEALCYACARKEARRIMSDIRDNYDTGWLPIGIDIDYDGGSYCGHCGMSIAKANE